MKIGGLWLLVFGYTIAYVGWQNLNGNTISFVGAIHGDKPTSQAASASDSQPSILSVLANPLGTIWQLAGPGTTTQSYTAPTAPSKPTPTKGGVGGMIEV